MAGFVQSIVAQKSLIALMLSVVLLVTSLVMTVIQSTPDAVPVLWLALWGVSIVSVCASFLWHFDKD